MSNVGQRDIGRVGHPAGQRHVVVEAELAPHRLELGAQLPFADDHELHVRVTRIAQACAPRAIRSRRPFCSMSVRNRADQDAVARAYPLPEPGSSAAAAASRRSRSCRSRRSGSRTPPAPAAAGRRRPRTARSASRENTRSIQMMRRLACADSCRSGRCAPPSAAARSSLHSVASTSPCAVCVWTTSMRALADDLQQLAKRQVVDLLCSRPASLITSTPAAGAARRRWSRAA